jgi:hypothetical protein
MFHERLEAGQYDAIFAAAAPAFQKSVQHEAFTQYLATIHDKMGSCSPPSKADNYFANSNQSGTTVQMRYHVECSKGRLDEGMTFLMKNGAAKLLQYDASSPFLMR